MEYALKNIALFKIDPSTPDQTCQIYVELVLFRYQHCKCYNPCDQNMKKKGLGIKLLLRKTGCVQ